MTIPAMFQRTLSQTQAWLHDLQDHVGLRDEQQAYKVLRGVLHTLRDRMPSDQAAQLGAQLPTLVRGIYYEAWPAGSTPDIIRSKSEYLDTLYDRIGEEGVDPEQSACAVHGLLAEELEDGAVDNAVHLMNGDLKDLWPERVRARAAERFGH